MIEMPEPNVKELAAAAYRAHRDGCKSCTCDELCDKGLDLYGAKETARQIAQSDEAEFAQGVE